MALAKQGGSSSASSHSKDIRQGIKPTETKSSSGGDVAVAKVPGGTKQNPKRPC